MNNNDGPPPYISFGGTMGSSTLTPPFQNGYWLPPQPPPPIAQFSTLNIGSSQPSFSPFGGFYTNYPTSQQPNQYTNFVVQQPSVQHNFGRKMSRQEQNYAKPSRFFHNSDIQLNPSRATLHASSTHGEPFVNPRLPANHMANGRLSVCSEYGDSENGLSQFQDDVVETGSSSQDGGVLIYIDNSNIWINTMEASAKQLGFKGDIKQDLRTRVNIIKLLTLAAAERPIIRAVLYGSEPPPISKFWNNIKEIKFCKVDVQVTRRSTYSNREREVDQSIMLDIGVDLVIHQNHARHGGTIIIFTGDGGMVTAVRRALEYGWNVELWAYRNSLAKGYLDEVEKNEKFKIVYLDDHFHDFVFYKFEWSTGIPHERSCVLTFRKIPASLKSSLLELFVKAFSQLVRMPMAGRYFNITDEDSSEENTNQTHLVIVCSVGKLILKEDARSDFYWKCKADSNSNTLQQNGSHTHQNANSKKSHNSFHFSPEQWNRVPDILNLPFLKEDPGDFNTRVKTEFEGLVDDAMRNVVESIDNPKYDFNQEIYRRIEQRIANPTSASSIPETTNQISGPSTSSKNVAAPTTGNSLPFNSEELNPLIKKYKPILRSLPQFLQDLKVSHDHADFDFEPMRVPLEAQGEEDDGEGNFIVQTNKKHRRKFQQYSEYCKFSFRCSNGFKCTYNHTDKEKEFFKLQPMANLRKTYKFKECDHYANDKCKYKKETSYMCPFSHGYFCLTCKADEDGGHNPRTCPVRPPRSQSALESHIK